MERGEELRKKKNPMNKESIPIANPKPIEITPPQQPAIPTLMVITPDGTPESVLPQTKSIIDSLAKMRLRADQLGLVRGGYGDIENCDGIVEAVQEPSGGGLMTKFFG